MSIPPEFQKYKGLDAHERERAFQAEVVVPLLQRMGFSVVWDNHGRSERGNDVIVADVDRFNHRVYYGAQVKYRDSIGQSDAAELIDDVREAFTCGFREPKRDEEGHISRFYIINSGSISPDAAEVIRNGITRWTPAANVAFLEGKELLQLSQWAAYSRGLFIREQLTGLLLELTTNRSVCAALLAKLGGLEEGGLFTFRRCRLNAVSAYLATPPAIPQVAVAKLDEYWHSATMINVVTEFLENPALNKKNMSPVATAFKQRLARTGVLADELSQGAMQALAGLPSVEPWTTGDG
jgi:hypothetical protein